MDGLLIGYSHRHMYARQDKNNLIDEVVVEKLDSS